MLRKLYDWTMEKAAHRHAERWLAAFAFVEASFFPIPPHPLLGLMCLAEPNKAIRFAVIATLASVAGGMLGYAIGWGLYDTIGTQLLAWLGLTTLPSRNRPRCMPMKPAVMVSSLNGIGVAPLATNSQKPYSLR